MAWEQVAEGNVFQLANLSQYESQLEEGSRNWLQLSLRLPVTAGLAADLENILRDAGVENVRVTTNSPVLNIYFKKGYPWLIVIAAIILASLGLAILVTSWKLFTEVPWAIPYLALGGIALATLIGIYLVRRKT